MKIKKTKELKYYYFLKCPFMFSIRKDYKSCVWNPSNLSKICIKLWKEFLVKTRLTYTHTKLWITDESSHNIQFFTSYSTERKRRILYCWVHSLRLCFHALLRQNCHRKHPLHPAAYLNPQPPIQWDGTNVCTGLVNCVGKQMNV